jgi:NAD(P)-dependent dehydrogenase (short-subunit alcohol dehydrogenase family)
MDTNGKVALITGAGRRVGRSLALALGDAGCRVAVHYGQSEKDAQDTAALIQSMGSEAITIQADLEDPVQVKSLASSVASQLGPIEILVNNASIFDKVGLEDVSVEEWDRHFAINTRAPFILAQAMQAQLTTDVQANEIALGAILPPSDIPLDRPRNEIQIDLGAADRMGTLNEVSDAMMMLIKNDFITGETINVDGGRHIQ